MVIETDIASLEEGVEDFNGLADGLDQYTEHGAENSVWDAIETVVDDEIQNPVLKRARQRAKRHVGGRTSTIVPFQGEWVSDDTYRSGIGSDNEVVIAHENGSGIYSTGGEYVITPGAGNDVLAFEANGEQVVTKYVVHPGVRGKRFMQKSLSERTDTIARSVRDEAVERLGDAL